MFPFTPHTTLRLDFGLGGFLIYWLKNDRRKPTRLGLACFEAIWTVDVPRNTNRAHNRNKM